MKHSEVSALHAGCMNQSEVSALPAGCMNQSEVSALPTGWSTEIPPPVAQDTRGLSRSSRRKFD